MSRTWKKREREKKRRRKKRQKRRWKTKDAVRHDPIPVMKMISFERETRFLKPLVIVFIFYSSFVVESCDNQRDPWRPLALFFTWTFVILMRSVKQTTIQPRIVFPSILRFSFLPSFLFFLIWIKRRPRERNVRNVSLQDFFFGSLLYTQKLRGGVHLLSRTFHGREANFVK